MGKLTYRKWLWFCLKNIRLFVYTDDIVDDLSESLGFGRKFVNALIWVHAILWYAVTIFVDILIWRYPAAMIRSNMVWGISWLIVTVIANLLLTRLPSDLVCAAILKFKFREQRERGTT